MYKLNNLFDSSKYVEYHDELNPKLWSKNKKLKPDVLNTINNIVDEFLNELSISNINIDIKDIRFVGSNASFNYTDLSDIDIHLLAKMNGHEELYDAYRRIFNTEYEPKIKGYPVQIYVEDYDNPSSMSNGIYSISKNKWIKEPVHEDNLEIDEYKVNELLTELEEDYSDVLNKCDKSSDNVCINLIEGYLEDLYDLRKKGLKKGEFSPENLAFKELRSKGYINKLKEVETQIKNNKMTLDNKKADN